MMRIAAPTLFLLTLADAASAQTDIDLRYRFSKGVKMCVSQTIELQSERVDEEGSSMGKEASSPEFTLAESWIDESLADTAGKSTKAKRTVILSQVSDLTGKPEPTGLQGAAFSIEREGNKIEVTKGDPGEAALELMRRGTADPVELLIPEKAVKVGDTWDLAQDDTVRLFTEIGASLACIQGTLSEDVKRRFVEPMTAGEDSFAEGMDLKATLVSSAKGEVTIRLEGQRELKGECRVVTQGDIATATTGKVELTGILRINTVTQKPAQLDLTIHQVEYTGALLTVSRGDVQIEGLHDTWKIHRTWVRAK